MGTLPNVFPGYQPVSNEAVRKKFEAAWGVKLSTVAGLKLTEMFPAILEGDMKAMYIMGENPVLTVPIAGTSGRH